MPATLGQLIHVLKDVFSRIKHSSDIPGASRAHSWREQHLAVTMQARNLCRYWANRNVCQMPLECLGYGAVFADNHFFSHSLDECSECGTSQTKEPPLCHSASLPLSNNLVPHLTITHLQMYWLLLFLESKLNFPPPFGKRPWGCKNLQEGYIMLY